MRKRRVLFLSDYAGAFTGFGKNTKLLLTYLYKTGKYDILNAAQGAPKEGMHNHKFPWDTIGVVPTDPAKVQHMNSDGNLQRMAAYGVMELNDIVKDFKPDVVFSVNDTWGSQFVTDLPFFKHIPTVCWNTFDSLPLIPDTIAKADQIKHYWTWSDFARQELHKQGKTHVKNQYPLVNTQNFHKLPDPEVAAIKHRFGLPKDSFIIGMVFRNQLRKLINTQIEAYAMFRKANPEIKNTFLYTHTHYGEGWDIRRLCEQYGVNPGEILCTYICKESREYFVGQFHGQDVENPRTKTKTLVTTNVALGVSDKQLNEIYNLFDLYSHPATSGACELPCVEAALAEKIITTAPYSFGEDIIALNKGSIPMKFAYYTEHGTQFLKSQPSPYDLSKIFKKVYEMKPVKRRQMELDSRQWGIDNYSVEVNGSKIEAFIDELPILAPEIFEFPDAQKKKHNPTAVIPPNSDDLAWVKSLYALILDDATIGDHDEGVRTWMGKLSEKAPRKGIEDYFRHVAQTELDKAGQKTTTLEDVFRTADRKTVVVVQPESIGDIFLLTATFESLRNRYPVDKYKIFVATKPEYSTLLDGNPYIDQWVPYHPQMDSVLVMEGNNGNAGVCDIAYHPYFATQRHLSYMHNGLDSLDIDLSLDK
jgi:hypothetical protein